jgi:hypothetical protein
VYCSVTLSLLFLMFLSNWQLLAACISVYQQWRTSRCLANGSVIWVCMFLLCLTYFSSKLPYMYSFLKEPCLSISPRASGLDPPPLHNRQGIYGPAELLSASQEGICSKELLAQTLLLECGFTTEFYMLLCTTCCGTVSSLLECAVC